MGPVETGVRLSLRALGITSPGTALETLAIRLSVALDSEPEPNVLAGLSRELRLTLAQVADQPEPQDDPVDALTKRRAAQHRDSG